MHVLAIEPYFGGSHRAFLEGVVPGSRHRWTLATLPDRNWKWRMRSAPVAIADRIAEAVRVHGQPDRILCSDMFDLPTWLGFASRDKRFAEWLPRVPLITYFHENQWAYPKAPDARIDHHFGFTNLLTAAVSDTCWFNSHFNRRSFLNLSHSFLSRMPDAHIAVDLQRIQDASRVIAPGFQPPNVDRSKHEIHSPIRLGWVGRFEHDKRPDRFLMLLDRLTENGRSFELILLGQRGRTTETLQQIQQRYDHQIRWNGYAESRTEYESHLSDMDVVVSTADHEFFGIAICEAIWAGAIPVTPNSLSYPEYVPDSLRFDSTDQAAEIIARLSASGDREEVVRECRNRIDRYRIEKVINEIDAELERTSTGRA